MYTQNTLSAQLNHHTVYDVALAQRFRIVSFIHCQYLCVDVHCYTAKQNKLAAYNTHRHQLSTQLLLYIPPEQTVTIWQVGFGHHCQCHL